MSNFSYKLEWVCECGWNAVIEDGLSKGTCKVLCSQKTWTEASRAHRTLYGRTCDHRGSAPDA